ncbi:MAG TPA: FAD-binding oxidoreductase [Dyella sp.]|uniref:FAD-binding oxidoreductase n=1 Tax=Dyella sp. TaxID=1869338 RepID=UPI002F93A8F4
MDDLAYCLNGKIQQRDAPDYEAWRRHACWNQRDVARRPQYIVRARSHDDVVAAINMARERKLSIALRSGGHSFANAFLRRDGVLLDLSALHALDVEPGRRRAVVGPGVTSRALSEALAAHRLGFPTGHSGTVGLGGFLLGGGLGINFGMWGPMSAFQIKALDLVTADGKLRHASAEENPDLFWAARGGGPTLFFAVVSFELECHPLPGAMTSQHLRLSLEGLPYALSAITKAAPQPALQIMLAVVPAADSSRPQKPRWEIAVSTLAFAENGNEATALHAKLANVLKPWALDDASEEQSISFAALHDHGDAAFGSGRYLTDNILTDRPEDAARILISHLPTLPSSATLPLLIWQGNRPLPEAAFSAKGGWYFSTYARWTDPRDDEANMRWLRLLYDELQPIASHCYINEFDLEYRSAEIARCFSSDAWLRLAALKRRYDPSGVFHDLPL